MERSFLMKHQKYRIRIINARGSFSIYQPFIFILYYDFLNLRQKSIAHVL